MTVARDVVYESVQGLAAEKDLFAAAEYVLGLGDPSTVIQAFAGLLRDCHHKAKSTRQVIFFAHAGITYCLQQAAACDDPELARERRFSAKRMGTNAASFAWPGWNEEGVTVTQEQMVEGLALARYSIRQLRELDPTPEQLGFSLWFLGAQLIANEHYEEAHDVFNEALGPQPDEAADGAMMLRGYIGLTQILMGDKEKGEAGLYKAIDGLRALETEDATFYAHQLVTAREVFEG